MMMRKPIPGNWLLIGAVLLGAFGRVPAIYAQSTASEQSASAAVVPADTTARAGEFAVALRTGSNSSFFGRTQTKRYPYAALELTYTTNWLGIWGSVASYDLFPTSTLVDETDLSLGWDGDLSKRVDASISYSHFLYAAESPLVKSTIQNALDGYVGWDWGYAYTRLNVTYAFGSSQDGFVYLDNSRYFKIPHVFGSKGFLAVEPRLSVTAGTQHFVETIIKQRGLSGRGPVTGKGGSKRIETTRFRVLSYELRVPVTYTLGHVALQAAWRYSLPVNLLANDVTVAQSYFTAGCSINF